MASVYKHGIGRLAYKLQDGGTIPGDTLPSILDEQLANKFVGDSPVVERTPKTGDVDALFRKYVPPHLREAFSRTPATAEGIASVIGPAADVQDMKNYSAATMNDLRAGNYLGSLANFGMTGAALGMMALPGSVGGIDRAVEGVQGKVGEVNKSINSALKKYNEFPPNAKDEYFRWAADEDGAIYERTTLEDLVETYGDLEEAPKEAVELARKHGEAVHIVRGHSNEEWLSPLKAPSEAEHMRDVVMENGGQAGAVDDLNDIFNGSVPFDEQSARQAAHTIAESEGWKVLEGPRGDAGRYFDIVKTMPNGTEKRLGVRVSDHARQSATGHAIRGKSKVDINIAPTDSQHNSHTFDDMLKILREESPSPTSESRGLMSGDLPMDTASRMKRMEEMGYDTSRPLYHATLETGPEGKGIEAFIPSQKGGRLGPGVYFSPKPGYSGKYAKQAKEGSNVIPTYVRGNLAKTADIDDSLKTARERLNKQIGSNDVSEWKALADEILKERGFVGKEFGEEIVVFDPKNIRSLFAEFDPAKKDLPGLSMRDGGVVPGPRSVSRETRPTVFSTGIPTALRRVR